MHFKRTNTEHSSDCFDLCSWWQILPERLHRRLRHYQKMVQRAWLPSLLNWLSEIARIQLSYSNRWHRKLLSVYHWRTFSLPQCRAQEYCSVRRFQWCQHYHRLDDSANQKIVFGPPFRTTASVPSDRREESLLSLVLQIIMRKIILNAYF